METRELEYYLTILEEGNLTKAAVRLYVSQPTLSKYLQRLEQQIGTPLLEHHGRKITPTYAGLRYKKYAIQLLSTLNEMNTEMQELASMKKGRLRIGMPSIRSTFTLPILLPAFKQFYPDIEITLLEDHSDNLEEALRQCTIDIAFLNVLTPLDEFDYTVLHEDDLYVVLSPDHPLHEKKELTLKELEHETLIMQSSSQRIGAYIHEQLRNQNLHPRQLLNTNILSSITLAHNGYGIAFLSGDLLHHMPGLEKMTTIPLHTEQAPFHFCAVQRKGAYSPAYLTRLISITEEIYSH